MSALDENLERRKLGDCYPDNLHMPISRDFANQFKDGVANFGKLGIGVSHHIDFPKDKDRINVMKSSVEENLGDTKIVKLNGGSVKDSAKAVR